VLRSFDWIAFILGLIAYLAYRKMAKPKGS
jgi:hypothetical protein